MAGWRSLLSCAAATVAAVVAAGVLASPAVAALPAAAAVVALLGAALAGDYFGVARRHHGWAGAVAPTAARRAALAALERRFARARAAGGVRTGHAARALLVALAEHGQLRRAADVVDFLAAEALTRPHADVVADALRALAQAELGRLAAARQALDALARHAAQPVVAYAAARLAELDGRPEPGLRAAARALGDRPRQGALRDVAVVRARLLARTGRVEDARRELGRVAADGGRAAVEALAVADDAPVALAARQALGLAAVYR